MIFPDRFLSVSFFAFLFVSLCLFTPLPAFVFLFCRLCVHCYGPCPRVSSGDAAEDRLPQTDMSGQFGKLEKLQVTE